jgi:hypothetical protein
VVTFTVDVTKVPLLAVGQTATVQVDGRTAPVTGRVTRVAAAPTSSSGTAYAVTLGLDGDVSALRDGTQASVVLTVKQVTGALSVPSSAVRTVGTSTVVLVVDGSGAHTTPVTVAAVGPVYTAVSDGLAAGQEVVLADLDAALPTSNTSTTNRFGGGAGGGSLLGGTGAGVRTGFGGGVRPGG